MPSQLAVDGQVLERGSGRIGACPSCGWDVFESVCSRCGRCSSCRHEVRNIGGRWAGPDTLPHADWCLVPLARATQEAERV